MLLRLFKGPDGLLKARKSLQLQLSLFKVLDVLIATPVISKGPDMFKKQDGV